jgi:hypothetical protein
MQICDPTPLRPYTALFLSLVLLPAPEFTFVQIRIRILLLTLIQLFSLRWIRIWLAKMRLIRIRIQYPNTATYWYMVTSY